MSDQNDRLLLNRYAEAYINMAKQAHYRPAAPGDGCGGIYLSDEELSDPQRLKREAQQYAVEFLRLEEGMNFHIGHADFSTNRALVYTIEAARQLCGGFLSRPYALKLLEMAQAEVKAAPVPRVSALPNGENA
jgi:hypothetical protein